MKGHDWCRGVWVAMVSPWDGGNDRPRSDAIQILVDRFVEAGVDGLFILGTTGEGTLLHPARRKEFAETTISKAKGNLPVIVHTGHDSTPAVIDLSLHAREIGAVAVAVAPPTRYRMDGKELFQHYAAVAESLGDFPLLLYDIPGTTCNPLSGDFLKMLRDKYPNVIGAKVSRTDWDGWRGYLEHADDLPLLVGVDELIYPLMAMGARGIVSSFSNIFPELYVELFKAVENGDIDKAKELQKLVWKLADICHHASPLAYVKGALRALGIDVGTTFPPLRELDDAELTQLEEAIGAFRNELKRRGVRGGRKR